MYSEISANKRKTILLMIFFVGLLAALAYAAGLVIGNLYITPYVLVGALIYTAISYFAGTKMALAVNGAKQIQKSDNLRLWRIVENLSITEGLPMPKVYIMDDPAPNAFATGRDPDHAVVAATTGLLDIMDDQELEGVMAHELGHVKNYDIRVSMIAFALAAVIGLIADMLVHFLWFRDDESPSSPLAFALAIFGIILAPLVATMIQLAISRRREYLADATGALATRYPEGLASALEKISSYGSTMRKQHTATAHLFFANPLRKTGFSGLFSTHPPVDERVRRLREMGTKA